jgi:hypothetical protein
MLGRDRFGLIEFSAYISHSDNFKSSGLITKDVIERIKNHCYRQGLPKKNLLNYFHIKNKCEIKIIKKK